MSGHIFAILSLEDKAKRGKDGNCESDDQIRLGVDRLRCEHLENPLGIDAVRPRFNCVLLSDHRNTMQTAYRIQVATSSEALTDAAKLVWDSGVVESDSSVLVDFNGPSLVSFQRYRWRVKVWDNHGRESDWSQPAWFEMGILSGKVVSAWKLQQVWMTYSLTIPANSTATVCVPKAIRGEVSEGNRPLEEAVGVLKVSQDTEGVKLEVGSGSYQFRYRLDKGCSSTTSSPRLRG